MSCHQSTASLWVLREAKEMFCRNSTYTGSTAFQMSYAEGTLGMLDVMPTPEGHEGSGTIKSPSERENQEPILRQSQ